MTPEQAIGAALAAVDRLRDYGMRPRRRNRDQAFGAVAMAQLRDAGYEVVQRTVLDGLRESDRRYRAVHMIQRHPVKGDPASTHVLDQMVRDVLYRRFPLEVHADVLRDVAAEVAERVGTAIAEADRSAEPTPPKQPAILPDGRHTVQCICDGRGIVPGPVGGRAEKCPGPDRNAEAEQV